MTITDDTAADEAAQVTTCSFCQKATTDIGTMVAGPGVFICDACVAFCVELIESKSEVMPKLARWQDRLSDEDVLATLPKFQSAAAQVDRELASWVSHLRSRGITWTRIGAALGMTRQSAWERFSGEE